MFRKFLIISFILLVGFCSQANSQAYSRGLFGTATAVVDFDTLAASADSLETRTYTWAWRSMQMESTVYGEVWVLTGQVRDIIIKFTPYYPNGEFGGTAHLLDTLTVTDSLNYEFHLSNQDWWGLCSGGKVSFVPDSTTSSLRIVARELTK